MCDCIATINEKLRPQNARLSLTLTFGGDVTAYPHIPLEKLDKSKRGKAPTAFIPSYCPFCGEKYQKESE